MALSRGRGVLVAALSWLLIAGCTTRESGKGLRQTQPVRHGFNSCTTGIEHLPYGWDVSTRQFASNYDKTMAVWAYVTICKSGWGFGSETPVGYQLVAYDPGHPAIFTLEGDELQKYLDENTIVSVDTTDIKALSPIVTHPGKLTADVHQGDRAALHRDLEIQIQCTPSCDGKKVDVHRREWNGAKLYVFLWDGSAHQL